MVEFLNEKKDADSIRTTEFMYFPNVSEVLSNAWQFTKTEPTEAIDNIVQRHKLNEIKQHDIVVLDQTLFLSELQKYRIQDKMIDYLILTDFQIKTHDKIYDKGGFDVRKVYENGDGTLIFLTRIVKNVANQSSLQQHKELWRFQYRVYGLGSNALDYFTSMIQNGIGERMLRYNPDPKWNLLLDAWKSVATVQTIHTIVASNDSHFEWICLQYILNAPLLSDMLVRLNPVKQSNVIIDEFVATSDLLTQNQSTTFRIQKYGFAACQSCKFIILLRITKIYVNESWFIFASQRSTLHFEYIVVGIALQPNITRKRMYSAYNKLLLQNQTRPIITRNEHDDLFITIEFTE